jgi:WD40 repeat protein
LDGLRLLEVASGASRALEGHSKRVRAVAFSPDGRHIVSGAEDRTLRLWELATGCTIARLDGDDGFTNIGFARHVNILAVCDERGRVHLLDALLGGADQSRPLVAARRPASR